MRRERRFHNNEEARKLFREWAEAEQEALAELIEQGRIKPYAIGILDAHRISPRLVLAIIRAHKRLLGKERETIPSVEEARRAAEATLNTLIRKKRKATDKDLYNALRALNDFIAALVHSDNNVKFSLIRDTIGRWYQLAAKAGISDYADLALALWISARKAKHGDSVNLRKMATNYGALLPQITVGTLASPWMPHIAANIYNTMVLVGKHATEELPSERQEFFKALLREYLLRKADKTSKLEEEIHWIPTSIQDLRNKGVYVVDHTELANILAAMLFLWQISPPDIFVPGVLIFGVRGVGKTSIIEQLAKSSGINIVKIAAPAFLPKDLFIVVDASRAPELICNTILSSYENIQNLLNVDIEDENSVADALREQLKKFLSADEAKMLESYVKALTTFIRVDARMSAEILRKHLSQVEQQSAQTQRVESIRRAAEIAIAELKRLIQSPYAVEEGAQTEQQQASVKLAIHDDTYGRFVLSIAERITASPIATEKERELANNIISLFNELQYLKIFHGNVTVDYIPIRQIAERAKQDLILFIDEIGYNPGLMESLLTFMTHRLLGTVKFKKVFVIAASNMPEEGIDMRGLEAPALSRFVVLVLQPTKLSVKEFAKTQTIYHYLRAAYIQVTALSNIINKYVRQHYPQYLERKKAQNQQQQETPQFQQQPETQVGDNPLVNALLGIVDIAKIIEELYAPISHKTTFSEKDFENITKIVDKIYAIENVLNTIIPSITDKSLSSTLNKSLTQLQISLNNLGVLESYRHSLQATLERSALFTYLPKIMLQYSAAIHQDFQPNLSLEEIRAAYSVASMVNNMIGLGLQFLSDTVYGDPISQRLVRYIEMGAKTQPFHVAPTQRSLHAVFALITLLPLFLSQYDIEKGEFVLPMSNRGVAHIDEPTLWESHPGAKTFAKIIIGLLGETLGSLFLNNFRTYISANRQQLLIDSIFTSFIDDINKLKGAPAGEEGKGEGEEIMPPATIIQKWLNENSNAPTLLLQAIIDNFSTAAQVETLDNDKIMNIDYQRTDAIARTLTDLIKQKDHQAVATTVLATILNDNIYGDQATLREDILKAIHQQALARLQHTTLEHVAAYLNFLLLFRRATEVSLQEIAKGYMEEFIVRQLQNILSSLTQPVQQKEHASNIRSLAKLLNIVSENTTTDITNALQIMHSIPPTLRFLLAFLYRNETQLTSEYAVSVKPLGVAVYGIKLRFMDTNTFFTYAYQQFYDPAYDKIVNPTLFSITNKIQLKHLMSDWYTLLLLSAQEVTILTEHKQPINLNIQQLIENQDEESKRLLGEYIDIVKFLSTELGDFIENAVSFVARHLGIPASEVAMLYTSDADFKNMINRWLQQAGLSQTIISEIDAMMRTPSSKLPPYLIETLTRHTNTLKILYEEYKKDKEREKEATERASTSPESVLSEEERVKLTKALLSYLLRKLRNNSSNSNTQRW